MAVRELEVECIYNDQQHVVKLVQDLEKGLFLVGSLLPLLALEHDEDQSQRDWRSRLLHKLDISVNKDPQGREWISRNKTWELLQSLKVQDAFQGVFDTDQGSQTNDTDHDEDANTGEKEVREYRNGDSNGDEVNENSGVPDSKIAQTEDDGIDVFPKRVRPDQQLGSPLKKLKPAESFLPAHSMKHDLQFNTPLTIQPAKKPVTNFAPEDRVKLEQLLQHILFPDSQAVRFETALANLGISYPNNQLNLDISIDEHGNTPLHWLCSVANVRLTKDLINHGADRFLGDKTGESALVKAVKSVNNYDSGTFEELLDFLYPCLTLVDDMSRSVLHHIVITSGMPGCAAAAKYYLDILMGWIVKKQTREISSDDDPIMSALDLKWFINHVLNARDTNGDTCLNIASRLGNVSIVEALLDYGADPRISNNSGLRPVDFGAGATKLEGAQTNNTGVDGSISVSGPNPSMLINNIQSLVKTISQDYEMEIKQHKDQLSMLHRELDNQRQMLTTSREKLAHARHLRDEHTQLTEQISNIQQAILQEDADFKKVSEELGIDDESLEMAEFDADEPFRIDFIFNFLENKLQNDYSGNFEQFFEDASLDDLLKQLMQENSGQEESIPPEALLRARITAYEKNEHNLNESLKSVREKQAHLEGRFRRVLSLCLKVEGDKIDGMLDGLLRAISSEDPEDIDTNEMQMFLSKHAV
ncbi:LAME_0G01662g1_1 [Lachancea meyersii CBS 8951]|uniref:LAME_0G01662g1_1 n=1 Tax=Lachancea meyersii CBS 8951 TaxID=1266667 RepID=A0A1G4K5J6_9SACH|nr:LAME_0G01662g1_1 [Lachancea meyersii CBS 8951]